MTTLRVWADGCQPGAPAGSVAIVDLPLRHAPRWHQLCCRRYQPRQVWIRVKLLPGDGRPDTIIREGVQDDKGSVAFASTEALEVDVAEGRRLRFEVIDRTGAPATRLVLDSPVAFAEIEAKDLARKKRWRLLLSDPATSEAVYGSPPRNARWTRSDAEAPPTVRKPSFLLLRTEADTALSKGRLSAATTVLPEDRSTAMVSLASSVASKPPLEENLAMPMLERPSRPEPSRQEDTRSSLGSLVTNSSRPKVMLMTRGTRGDVQPFVALARGLILYHNCDVVLVTELLWKNFVKSAAEELPLPYQGRLRFRPCGGDTSRRVSGDMARFVLSLGQDSLALQALVFSRSEVEFFSSEGCFFHWAWEERPTFIVFGFLMIHVAMIISEALQIPIVGFILQPLREIEPTMERTALDELFGPLRRVFAGQKFNAVLQQVMESLPDRYTLRDLRLSRGLAPCPSNILASNQQAEELRHHNVPLIVPVSPVALGEQVATLAEKGMRLTDFIFLRQGSCQLDAEVSDFIARAKQDRRKVVAMTFSSMPVGERRMLEIAAAICRRCHTPEEGRKPVVIALVSGQPPEETNIPDIQRLEEKHRLLVLRRPVDFGALFPKVDAAILHGGLGVTSEALLAGIPVVTSGILLMDQRYWAARIHELGSGCEGVPVNYLLKPVMGSGQELPVVNLIQQALDRRAGEDTWYSRAQEIQRKLKAEHQDDPDGIRRNADIVFRAGTEQAAIVRDGYKRRRSCCKVFCRQTTCLVRCLEETVRWLLCFQVPACLWLWMKLIYWCLCCAPLRHLFFWLFPRGTFRNERHNSLQHSMSSISIYAEV